MFRHRTIVSRLSTWGAPSAAFLFSVIAACGDDSGSTGTDGGMDATSSSSGSGSSSGSSSGRSSSSGSTGSSSSSSSSGSTSSSGSSSSSSGSTDSGPPDSGQDVSSDGTSTCSSPGMAVAGPADDHCHPDAGGNAPITVDPSLCNVAIDGGDMGCPYDTTKFNMEADDDDCKYHVKWSSTPICEGDGSPASPGVGFTVTATYLLAGDAGAAGGPVTGAGIKAEIFETTPGDQDSATYCDNATMHPGPQPGEVSLTESTANPGTYSGIIEFDAPGAWTVRFHIHEECYDQPQSPHGHAAFHIMVP